MALWSWINYPLKCTINTLTSLSLSSYVISPLSWQLSDGISEPAIIHTRLSARSRIIFHIRHRTNEVYLCIHTDDTIEEHYGRLNLLTLVMKTLLPYPIKGIEHYIISFCFADLSFSYFSPLILILISLLILIPLLTNTRVFIRVYQKIT